jgi:hypothetical protein
VGATGAGVEGVDKGEDAGIVVVIESATDLRFSFVYKKLKVSVFIINSIATVNVNFVKNPAGPLAPNIVSLLPLYAPKPILELFCNNTATVITNAKIICTIKSVDVIYSSFYKT